jgi:hypothetical protein
MPGLRNKKKYLSNGTEYIRPNLRAYPRAIILRCINEFHFCHIFAIVNFSGYSLPEENIYYPFSSTPVPEL